MAAGAFHAAYGSIHTHFLVLLYLFALLQLARARTWRGAFYAGLTVGLLIAVLRLGFFWRIFGGGAVALWLVFAFWPGLFVALARLALLPTTVPGRALTGRRQIWSRRAGWLLLPCLWCGVEYFRSELYYFKFTWLTPGFVFSESPTQVPLALVGTYGTGLLLMSLSAGLAFLWERSKIQALALVCVGMGGLQLAGRVSATIPKGQPAHALQVAGVQLEFPTEDEVLGGLDRLVRQCPEAELLVLSEYTFTRPIPAAILNWCREHKRYLIAGGEEPLPGSNFYNTAYVISPAGEIVFRQVKSVPIQCFRDGKPAPEQHVWESPWGKLGICICYDLSYSRVTDELIRQGAEALIVPTMDVADWGLAQHELHGRVAPLRAVEYGVPIFRLASSGISQVVNRSGAVTANAPYPGAGAVLAGSLELRGPGHLPLDRWMAWLATGLTGVAMVFWFWRRLAGGPKLPTANSPPSLGAEAENGQAESQL